MQPITLVPIWIAIVAMTAPAFADVDTRDHQIAQLRTMVETLQGEVATLRAQTDIDWMTQQRTEQIRGLVQDVLADADTRASLQGDGATSGYDGGFIVQSADGKFKLKVSGQIQTRFMYNDAAGLNHDYGFELRRSKVKLSGHLIDQSLTYKIAIANQRNSQGDNDPGEGMFVEDAWLSKKSDSGLYWKVGQMKAPFTREELVSSSAQLTVERSGLNNQFTYGWTQGIEIGNQGDDFWWRAWLGDGPNSANIQSANVIRSDSIAIVARADIRLDGDWKDWATMTGRGAAGDSTFIGAAFQWFNGSDVPGNSTEYGGYSGTNSFGFTVDGSVTRGNWTAFGAVMWASGSAAGGARNAAWGVLAQLGHDVSDDTQIFARYEFGKIDNYAVSGSDGDNSVLTVGFSHWLTDGRNVKWTTDFGYAFDQIADGGTGASADYASSGNGWRADNAGERGQWLIRTQMQLLF